MREKLKVCASGTSLVFTIPATIRKLYGLKRGKELAFDFDPHTGIGRIYFSEEPVENGLPIHFPDYFTKEMRELATKVIRFLRSEGPHRLDQMLFLMPTEQNKRNFQEIKEKFLRTGNMYFNNDKRLGWVEHSTDQPKNIVYHQPTAEERAKIAQENAVFEAKLQPKVDEAELDASLEAEVVDVLKEKEKPVVVKKED